MIKTTLKKWIQSIDAAFHTNFYQKLIRLQALWANSSLINAIRRRVDFLWVRFAYNLGLGINTNIKLHLACGKNRREGFINIDWRKTVATDLICDIKKLPYPDDSIKLIEIYHAIEHIPRHDFKKALKEWYRVLEPKGRLIIEWPDFDEIVNRYLQGNEKQLDGIFGLQRFEGDFHVFGYNVKRLSKLLKESRFANIEQKPPQDYHVDEWPCLRIECVKDNPDRATEYE